MRDLNARLLSTPFPLWDVRDVEAHVRTLLDARLREWGARLSAAQYEDALTYLVDKCWELAGLNGDGKTLRYVYVAVIHVTAADAEPFVQELGPFPREDRCREIGGRKADEIRSTGALVVLEVISRRPRGAYEPSAGLAFATYSRRILTARVVDWYRQTFGDSRYGSNRRDVSLDALVESWERDGEGAAEAYLDRCGPGARVEFLDELNRHAYHDETEEVLTRAAIGC